MEEKDFWKQYFFTPMRTITVVNPDSDDFTFSISIDTGVDMATGKPQTTTREYTVAAGAKRVFPGPVANMYLDRMFKLLVQKDDRVGMLPDFGERQKYYDKLIVSNVDMIDTVFDLPIYKDDALDRVGVKAEEVAFGMVKDEVDAAKNAGATSERPTKKA